MWVGGLGEEREEIGSMQLVSAESNKALGCKYRCVSVTFPFHYDIQIFEQKTDETGFLV